MDRCYITGDFNGEDGCIIERHHVFGASNRTRSAFYGFIVPLRAELHPNGARASEEYCKQKTGKSLREFDISLRQECQRYWENVLGFTRERFIKEFGKNYL